MQKCLGEIKLSTYEKYLSSHQHLSAWCFFDSPICLHFHLELCGLLPFTEGTLPHSHEWVYGALVTYGAT
jgi:hypothetical protein